MELKVKEVPGPGQKSVQEVEEQLLEQHEENQTEVVDNATEAVEEQAVEQSTPKFGEEDVLSFIRDRYNKEINSVDDLFAQRERDAELPEDVSAFLKYKKETGRGIDDFMKLQADYDKMKPDQLLRDYYAATEDDLDSEDIEYLMSEKFSYDEDLDDESEVKQKNITKKRELAKAKKYFNELKETYKVPVGSASVPVNEDELETYNAYKEYISQSQSIQEENQKRSEYFTKKTNDLFNDEFKGFEFVVGDQKMVFAPGDASEIKKIQSDVNNFISKYIDENGMISDHVGYHKALSAALNPDKLAAYFYEKGKSDAVGDVTKKSKNIDMDVRSTPQQMSTNQGFKVRAVESSSGRGLKIRKNS
jgi:predicted nucleic acid-binding protein